MIEPIWRIEREAIIDALLFFGGNRTRTAEALEISVRNLRQKIRIYQSQGYKISEANGEMNVIYNGTPRDSKPPIRKTLEILREEKDL